MSLNNRLFYLILLSDKCKTADSLAPFPFSSPCSIMVKHFGFGKLNDYWQISLFYFMCKMEIFIGVSGFCEVLKVYV